MVGHKTCFYGEISQNYPCYPFLSGVLGTPTRNHLYMEYLPFLLVLLLTEKKKDFRGGKFFSEKNLHSLKSFFFS